MIQGFMKRNHCRSLTYFIFYFMIIYIYTVYINKIRTMRESGVTLQLVRTSQSPSS